MPTPEAVIIVLREWQVKAENDLTTAAHTLTLGDDGPTDTVCFHAQQCVEKYLKALLVYRATPFPKTHDLGKLVALLPPDPFWVAIQAKLRKLSAFAVETRYPGEFATRSLAQESMRTCREVRDRCRHLLKLPAMK